MPDKQVNTFSDLITNPALLTYLDSASFSAPTPVQIACIPKLLGSGHFSVQSRTGTGKTLAYLLPIIERLKALEANDEKSLNRSPKVVIVAPTRELAMQIFHVAKVISHFTKLRIRKLVGGDKGKSLQSIFSNPIDILVATPDRCLRSFKNKELSKESLKFLVLDEADQLLEPSFKKTMQELAFELSSANMQLFLVSASRPARFAETIYEFFPGLDLQNIGAGEENSLNTDVSIFNIALEELEKFRYAKDFIRKQKDRSGIIFMGNKDRAKRLYEEVQATGYKNVFVIHKDLEIKERVAVADDFRSRGGILIATDIFARGIDIPRLQWILNFDLPSEPYYYLHRNGRVGRAGRTGEVFNFITSKDTERLARINHALAIQGRVELKLATPKPLKIFKKKKKTPKGKDLPKGKKKK